MIIEYSDSFLKEAKKAKNFELADQIREELKITEKAYIPLDHPPGEAQVDFGEARFIEKGIIYDGHYVNISFPYSNGGYTQLFKSENQECLLEGLKNIFEHIQGVPTVIWFDNMSTAVKKIKEHGKRDLSEGFYRFMMHYGFESNFCNPSSGNEKGSVENKVGYHRRNLFVPIPQFNDIREYNKTLLKKLDEDMNREHYKGIGKIQALFEEEKKSLKTLPQVPYEVCKYIYAKADKYAKVRYDSKIYSTTPQYAGKEVLIKVKAEEIEILNKEYAIIVKHKRLYGNQKESMQWLPYLELLSKRPTAIKYSGFIKELPSTIQEFLQSCNYENKKETLKIFTKMSVENGMETAIEAFEKTITYGTIDPDSLWATYQHITSGSLLEVEVKVPPSIPKLKQYKPDISRYDEFIKVEG